MGEHLVVLLQLQKRDACHFVARARHLYVWVSHGRNTMSDDHYRMPATRIGISRGLLRRREAQLRDGLRPFEFGPEPISLVGYNGVAFTLEGGITPGCAP